MRGVQQEVDVQLLGSDAALPEAAQLARARLQVRAVHVQRARRQLLGDPLAGQSELTAELSAGDLRARRVRGARERREQRTECRPRRIGGANDREVAVAESDVVTGKPATAHVPIVYLLIIAYLYDGIYTTVPRVETLQGLKHSEGGGEGVYRPSHVLRDVRTTADW